MAEKYDLIGATGCATGIAHTYMAQEALENAAKKMGYTMKVETHGQTGVDDPLTPEEISNAKAVVVASDVDVDADRFAGKKVVQVPVADGIKEPENLINRALADSTPIFKANLAGRAQSAGTATAASSGTSFWHLIYTSLMNGISHMLPFVVAGGVLMAISMFWGIDSANVKSSQYNAFAAMLNTIGSTSMNLMVPVLGGYIAEAIAKRSGLIIGFIVGMIAFVNGTGFLGGIAGGYIAGGVILLLQKAFKPLPDKEFRGLKAIFLYPVVGALIAGTIMWYISTPMADLNRGMMTFLKGMQTADPILLGLIIGVMCAADMGGPINKAAYITGTALLAQGNFYFMAGVSAACIAPPLATGFAVLMNKKAYTRDERSAGYVNFLLGSTHITEGAIPFAAKNPLLNIPSFMVGSAIAAILTYVTRITVHAPHGGFLVLGLVNKPFLWVLWIVLGALVSGVLLALIAGHSAKKHGGVVETAGVDIFGTGADTPAAPEEKPAAAAADPATVNPADILNTEQVEFDVTATSRDDALHQLAQMAVAKGIATDAEAVYQKYLKREQENSTGMEQGIAIPHAQDASIQRSAMLVVRLSQPVTDWPSFDKQPIDTLISFLIPAEDNGAHLHFLSNTAKLLTHQSFIRDLKAAKTPLDVVQLFRHPHLDD